MSQLFEQALVAKLNAITALTALLGTGGIFKTFVPQTWQYDTNGAALTYFVPTKPYNHVLTGSDKTATARVQLDVWGYTESVIKQSLEAIRNSIDGPPGTWGDGSCVIVTVVQQDDTDLDEQPKAGTDQVLYHSMTEYSVMYRVTLPTLT